MAEEDSSDRPLDSWKAISDRLGVTVRTAQRWERERGLPVRRLGGAKGRVVADAEELDRWKAAVSEKPGWWSSLRLLRIYAGAVTLLAVALAGLLAGRGLERMRAGPPADFHFAYRILVVTDAEGREIWRHSFDRPILADQYLPSPRQQLIWFGDLDGDGSVETLFVYCPQDMNTSGTALYCFSQRGEVKWKFVPGRAVANDRRTFTPEYTTVNMRVVGAGRSTGPRIVLSSYNCQNSPAQIAMLDAQGRLAGEYWHAGHIDQLAVTDLDGDGVEEIVAGGVNNGWAAATLVVLDRRNMSCASDQGEGSPQFKDRPRGCEKAVLLFPRSCLNRKFEPYNMVTGVEVAPEGIRVRVHEKETDGVGLYTLDRKLNVTRFEFSDAFRATHRTLEVDRVLDHGLTDAETGKSTVVRYLRRF